MVMCGKCTGYNSENGDGALNIMRYKEQLSPDSLILQTVCDDRAVFWVIGKFGPSKSGKSLVDNYVTMLFRVIVNIHTRGRRTRTMSPGFIHHDYQPNITVSKRFSTASAQTWCTQCARRTSYRAVVVGRITSFRVKPTLKLSSRIIVTITIIVIMIIIPIPIIIVIMSRIRV